MKFIFPTLLLTLLVFTSCDKSDDNRPSGVLPSGEYVWISSSGGFVGETITVDEVDYTQKIIVNENRFTWNRNEEIVQDFKFDVEFVSTQTGSGDRAAYDIYRILDADLALGASYFFYQIEESYFFSDGNADGYTHEFRR